MNIHHKYLQKVVDDTLNVKDTLKIHLPKNHAPYKQIRISGRRGSVKQDMALKHLLSLALNYRTLFK